VFEINFKNENSPKPPAIKKKLEACHAAPPPTCEEIQEKLKKAENRRLMKFVRETNVDQKLNLANERRSNLVKEFTDKAAKKVDAKLETGE